MDLALHHQHQVVKEQTVLETRLLQAAIQILWEIIQIQIRRKITEEPAYTVTKHFVN